MDTKDSQEASPLSSQVIYSSATTSFSNEKISSMKTEPTQLKKNKIYEYQGDWSSDGLEIYSENWFTLLSYRYCFQNS